MALTFNIGANERAAVRAVKNLGEALEDATDTLDDLARQGDKDINKLEGSFEQLARQAKKTERAVDDVGGNGFDRVSAAGTEFKNEALQNFSEVTSSFDGSMSSIGDLAQGTLGGIASSIPGIGLLGGVAAVGVGLVTNELVKQEESAERLKERLSGAYQEAQEAGRRYLDTAAIIANASDLVFNPERADEWKALQADAVKLGLDQSIVLQANAGDTEAQRQVQERINALLADRESYYTTERDGIEKIKIGVQETVDRWGAVIQATKDQQENARTLGDVTKAINEEERAQIDRTMSASQARYEAQAEQIQKAREAERARYNELASLYGTPITSTIKVRLDNSEAERQLEAFQRRAAQGVRIPVGLGRTLE